MVAVGTIVWLSSELMFFAGLFAVYFQLRSVRADLWAEQVEKLNLPFASINCLVLVVSSVWCQLGCGRPSAARRPHGLLFDLKNWGMREWYVVTYLFGSFFIAGQVMEYAELVHENVTLSSDAYGSVFYMATGFHGLHVTGGLIAFLLIIARTFRLVATRTPTRRAPSSPRTTGTSSTSSGSPSSPPSTSSNDPRPRAGPDQHHHRPDGRQDLTVNALAARRRHPAAIALLILVGLLIMGGAYSFIAPKDANASTAVATASVEEGQKLFLGNCASCHGTNAQGTAVRTLPRRCGRGGGRLPGRHRPHAARRPDVQAPRNDVQFDDDEIAALAAYVASLGPGPAIPDEQFTTVIEPGTPENNRAIAEGGVIFRVNCAMCHNFAGAGGA